MGRFSGTTKEFKRYIGPLFRNLVQQITRKQKAAIGACEHCGAGGELDAAHVHGRDRTEIVNILLGTSAPDGLVDVDLKEFEQRFMREHDPVEKAILVLCTSCHRKYDALPTKLFKATLTTASATERPHGAYFSQDVLPISLDPGRPDNFKAKLLERRVAIVEVLYADGSVHRKPWNASRFSKSSNVFGNLRSRPEFRQGVWQESGIVKVNVRVVD